MSIQPPPLPKKNGEKKHTCQFSKPPKNLQNTPQKKKKKKTSTGKTPNPGHRFEISAAEAGRDTEACPGRSCWSSDGVNENHFNKKTLQNPEKNNFKKQ